MGVISYEDYFKKKKNKKKDEEEDILPIRNNDGVIDIVDLVELNNMDIRDLDAAVKEYTKEEEKRTWFDTGAFEDGYQIGDGLKTIGGTALNVGANLLRGAAQAGEGLAKLGAGGVAQISDWLGNEELAENIRGKLAGKNEAYNNWTEKYLLSSNFNKMSDSLDGVSITGEKTDDLTASVGQLLSSAATGNVGANIIMFGSSAGNELENAYKSGATNGEAWGSAFITGASEVLFEKLSGGIKFGGGTLDDIIPINELTNKIANKTAQTLVKFGIDAVGEGFEEVLTEVASNVGRKLTYEDEKTWKEILASDEALDSYLEAFIGGSVMGGGFNTSKAINSIKTGRNYDTGLTTNEQLVLDKEIESRKAEAKKQGKKLSNKDIKNIETEARNSLERGDISTDTIESVLDSETYNKYKTQTEEVKSIEKQIKELQGKKMSELSVGEYNDTTSQIKALQEKLKGIDTNTLRTQIDNEISSKISSDGLLQRSYYEKNQRSAKFEADLTKYDAKQQEVIKKAVDSGILNNTRKTHEFVDMVAKISADKGVSFDFANNQKLKDSGFAVEGKQVNGFVNENGVTINIDSNTALNSVVGHEITHVLEGTELYSELQQAVKEYATTKGVYDSKLKELTELYKDVKDANVENELTSDLVGEYLFSDTDFVNNLSAKRPNLFQKIYNEIKYLLKVATAGSKEARQLEKVKKTFEDAYRQTSSNTNTNTEYSIVGINGVKNLDEGKMKSALLNSYDAAQQLYNENKNKMSAKELKDFIYNQTYWYQDKNGKWKIEIPDKDMKVEFKQPVEIDKEYTLEDIVDHNILYSLYPEFKSYKLVVKNLDKNGFIAKLFGKTKNYKLRGKFNSETKTIFLNKNYVTDAKLQEAVRKTVIHELQHAIQHVEGFERGAKSFFGKNYASSYGEAEARVTSERIDKNSYERHNILEPFYKEQIKNRNERLDQYLDNKGIIDNVKDNLYNFLRKESSREVLKKLGIEIEEENKGQNPRHSVVGVGHLNQELDNSSFFVADNQGRKLTKEQQEYFKDSKVRDENGKLLTVYHGTRADFNVFESERVGQNYENGWSQSGKGFYFTDNKSEAQEFGDYSLGKADTNIKEVYLNITNPFDTSIEDTTLLSEIGKEYGIDQQFLQRGDFLLRWFRNNNIDASEVLKKYGYDGIVDYGHYVAFDSNQIKNVDNVKPTVSADIRYSVSDNTGRNLTEYTLEKTKNSKVRDENGNLMLMYHGSPDGSYTQLKGGTYFTPNKWYAERYTNTAASSISTRKKINNPKVYEAYLNIEKPFDLSDPEARKIYINDYVKGGNAIGINPYLSDAEYSKINNIDWTEVEDLKDFLQENEYDYDGIIANEGAWGGYGAELIDRGTSYIPFSEEQIIKANEDNTKYSLSSKVPLEDRVTGDELLDAQDLIDEVKSVGANVDEYGYVTVYHQTSNENAKKILETGKMISKELDIFFSTSKDAQQSEGKGQTKLEFKIPAEKLVLDDIFSDNADVKIPLNGGKSIDVSAYLVTNDNYSISNQNDISPIRNNNLTYGEDVKIDSIDLPIKEQVANLSNQVSEISNKLDRIAFGEATTQEEAENLSNVAPNNEAPIRNNLTVEESRELDTLEALPFDLTDNLQSRADELSTKEIGEPVIETEDIDRFVPAYERIDKNADLKPFYQAEAEILLGELKDTIKGQRMIIGDTSQFGSANDQQYIGIKRQTSEDIAKLLDGYGYSYSRIEAGLNRIIEDKSYSEASRTILNILEDRLIDGYKTVEGYEIPANNDFISHLKDTDVSTYNDEVYQEWANSFGELVKPEDILPVKSELQNIPKDPTKESSYDNEPDSDLVKKQKREFKKLGTKSQYISNKALELYEEIKELKKGVKASNDLSYILDHDLDWKSVKTALLNIKAKPDTTVNNNSVAESTIREMLNKQYETKYNDIKNMKEDLVTKTKKELRKALLVDENDFFINALDNAKNKSMALMNNTDTIRNTEIVFGRENGRKINELIFQKEIDNEADSIAWQNRERQEIKDLGIKARSKESAAVQKYGEKQWLTENGEVKEYGEAELKAEFKDPKTRERIKNAAKVIREKYDFYIDEANSVLTRLGFDPIPKRKDYMRHFQELNDVFSRYGIPFNAQSMQEHVLPTDINGLTEFWSPQKNYFANTQRRTGMKTNYDAITGIDGYIGGIANLIYHTEDIQRGRAFEELIRDTYGEDKGWDNLDNLPDIERMERAAKIQNNHLSNYAAWVHEWTNNIAGKKNKLDRSVEATLGRKAFTVLDSIRKQVGANMIGLNLSSSLTNLIAPVQAMAKTNKLAVVKGTADTIKNIFVKDNFMEKNRFLTARMGSDMISKNAWQKIQDAGFVFMKGMDWFSSNQIVRSKYYELRSKGVPEAQAHAQAGEFAARILGDRTKGANPQLYNSKLIGLVTQFQLEVNNQLYSMFYDTYQDSKENAKNNAVKTAAGMTFTLGQLFAFTHLFGKTFESIAGYNPTLDVIGILATALGLGDDEDEEKTTSERLKAAADQLVDSLPYVNILTGGGRIPVASGIPNLVGVATGGKDEYGNELTLEDELKKLLFLIPPTGGNQIKKTTQGLGMFDDDLPVAGSYTDSGNLRYPVEDTFGNRVQAALFGQYANENARDYFDNERQPLKSKQIQEYAELDMPIADYWKYREGLTEAGKTTDENEYSKYLDGEGNVYWYDKENKTVYDANYNEVDTSILDLEQATKSEQVFDYISNLDVTDEQKQIMFKNASSSATTDKYGYAKYVDSNNKTYWYDDKTDTLYDSKYKPVDNSLLNNLTEYNGKDFSNYNNFGSYEEFDYATHYPDKYKVITQIDSFENYNIYKSEIDNIKDYYSSDDNLTSKQKTALSKQRKSAVQQYIESLDLDVPQKIMLEKMAGGYSVKNYKNYMVSYIESLPITAEEKQTIHDQLFD